MRWTAARLLRAFENRGFPIRFPSLPFFLPVFFLWVLLFPACERAPAWVNDDGPLILITVDTLRADHLSCYGYTGLETTNFDRLASEGVRFADASSTMPMTLPSHSTIMTGLTPPVHTVRDNTDYFLPDSAVTLAERCSGAGMDTAGFISSFVLDKVYGMAQGFALYSPAREVNPKLGMDKQKDARTVTNEAIKWIRENGKERFFMWIHYFDPHENYAPPPEYLPPSGNPYDGEIAYVDDSMGRFFKELKRRNLYDEATIIVTADHGEGLGDHGEASHGFLTYQATVRVPLIIKSPGIPVHRVVEEPVSLADIHPTAIELLGLPPTGPPMDGTSLVALLKGEKKRDSRLVYFESYLPTLYMGWSGQRGVRSDTFKYIESSEPELYDLSGDPMERNNLFGESDTDVETLKRMLDHFREASRDRSLKAGAKGEHERNRAEWIENLIALGYIGGSKLDDTELERLDHRKNPREYVTDYETFLQDYLEGRGREMRGEYEAAMKHYDRAIRNGDTYKNLADLLTSAGRCCLHLNRLDESESYTQRALARDPDFLIALLVLGMIEDARGNKEKADIYYGNCLKRSIEKGIPFPQVSNKKIKSRAEAYLSDKEATR